MKKTLILIAVLFAGIQLASAQVYDGIPKVYFTQYTDPSPVKTDQPFTLTLESYITANVIRDTVKTSSDIVMILDVSTSMNDDMETGSQHSGYVISSTSSYSYSTLTGSTKYYYPYLGKYYQVQGLKSSGGNYYWAYFDTASERFYISGSDVFKASDKSTPTWNGSSGTKPAKTAGGSIEPVTKNTSTLVSFKLFTSGTVKNKLQALVESSVTFIDSMYVASERWGIDDRISVVTFAKTSSIACHLMSIKDNYFRDCRLMFSV